MKIGGGNYEEADIEQAKQDAVSIIFQKIPEGELLNAGRMVERSYDVPKAKEATSSQETQEGGSVEDQACDAASHRWSDPTTISGRTSVLCKRCNLVLATELQGEPSVVMVALLQQIPH